MPCQLEHFANGAEVNNKIVVLLQNVSNWRIQDGEMVPDANALSKLTRDLAKKKGSFQTL